MVADGNYRQLAPCPRCGYSDGVLSVPAAYAAARSTEAATRIARDDDATLARRRAARAFVDAAMPVVPANDLAMAPTNVLSGCGCGVVFFGIVASGAFAIYQLATDHQNGDSVLLVVSAVAGLLLILCLLWLPLALTRRQRIKAGKPAAAAIWRLGWYCCRCAVVYFQAGEEPAGIAPRQPLTPAQFKQIVWTAGRYGKSP